MGLGADFACEPESQCCDDTIVVAIDHESLCALTRQRE